MSRARKMIKNLNAVSNSCGDKDGKKKSQGSFWEKIGFKKKNLDGPKLRGPVFKTTGWIRGRRTLSSL